MVSSRILMITGLVAAAIGFGFGRLTVPDAGVPAVGVTNTVPGKVRTRSDIDHDSRSTNGPPSAENVSRSKQVRELLIISELQLLDDEFVHQELAEQILGANREDLPFLFQQIVREDDYSFEALEFLVRRWAQFDAPEIIRILQRNQSKNHWPGENGLYFKALAAYELASSDPEEALSIFEQTWRESGGPYIGTGPRDESPYDLVPDFFRRLAANDLPRGFQAALNFPESDDSLAGTVVAAVESGRGREMARLLDSVSEDQADWPRTELVEAWVRSDPDAASEWFNSLPASLQAELQDDYEEAREFADSPPVDP